MAAHPKVIASATITLEATEATDSLELLLELELELDELDVLLLLEHEVMEAFELELDEVLGSKTSVTELTLELEELELELEHGIIGLNGSARSEPQPSSNTMERIATIKPDFDDSMADLKTDDVSWEKLIIVIQIFQKSFFDSGHIRNNGVFASP